MEVEPYNVSPFVFGSFHFAPWSQGSCLRGGRQHLDCVLGPSDALPSRKAPPDVCIHQLMDIWILFFPFLWLL